MLVPKGCAVLMKLEVALTSWSIMCCPADGNPAWPGLGGLIAGCAVAAKGIWPGIHIGGVKTERFPAMTQVLEGIPIECGTSSIVEGIAVKKPGKLTLPLIRDLVQKILLVNENDLE